MSSTERKAGWVEGVRRNSPLFVGDRFRRAVRILAANPPVGKISMGIVAERALIMWIESLPDCKAKRDALLLVEPVKHLSEDYPDEQTQSPAAPPEQSDRPQYATHGI